LAAVRAEGGLGDVHAFVKSFILGGDFERLRAGFAVFIAHM